MGREDLQMHLALEEHVQTACLPLQREGDGDRREGKKTETRKVKLGNTRLHSAEDSPDEVNFNSAAVAANKNLLINGDVCEIRACRRASASASPRALTFGLNAVGWI